jgi:hypothetical protein
MEQMKDFDLFFMPKIFGSGTSCQDILGFAVKAKSLSAMASA